MPDLGEEERERTSGFSPPLPPPRWTVSWPTVNSFPFPAASGCSTPRHSPGHSCLYLSKGRPLVGGDELHVENGELTGPSPANTPDRVRALASLRKLSSYASEVEYVLAYHGGLYGPRGRFGPGGSFRLRRFSGGKGLRIFVRGYGRVAPRLGGGRPPGGAGRLGSRALR